MYNHVYYIEFFYLCSIPLIIVVDLYLADDAPCCGAKRSINMNFRAIVIALTFVATLFGGRTPNIIQYLRDRYDQPTVKF